jgi:hypothetical protein
MSLTLSVITNCPTILTVKNATVNKFSSLACKMLTFEASYSYTMDRCNSANTIPNFLLSLKTYCESLKMKLAILKAQRVILVFSIFFSIFYAKNKS